MKSKDVRSFGGSLCVCIVLAACTSTSVGSGPKWAEDAGDADPGQDAADEAMSLGDAGSGDSAAAVDASSRVDAEVARCASVCTNAGAPGGRCGPLDGCECGVCQMPTYYTCGDNGHPGQCGNACVDITNAGYVSNCVNAGKACTTNVFRGICNAPKPAPWTSCSAIPYGPEGLLCCCR